MGDLVYVDRHPQARWAQLTGHLDLTRFQTVCYVGANFNQFQFYHELSAIFEKITVIEIFEGYCAQLEVLENVEVIHADIAQYIDSPRRFDVVLWWHGVEHVPYEAAEQALLNCERMATHLVILGTPFGQTDSPAIDNNRYNVHRSAWYPLDFQVRGYQTATLGVQNTIQSNLLAWKWMAHG